MTELGVVLIGCGRMGRTHAAAILRSAGFVLRGCTDQAEQAAGELARETDIPWFTNLEDAVQNVVADVAVISTPPMAHECLLHLALERGLHVLVEKPMVFSTRAARNLFDEAMSRRLVLMVSRKFRYAEDLELAREWLAPRRRRIESFRVCFQTQVAHRGSWFGDVTVSGGGVMADNAAHAADVIHAALGSFTLSRVYDVTWADGVEVAAELDVVTQDGIPGRVSLSWQATSGHAPPYFRAQLEDDNEISVGWTGVSLDSGRTQTGSGYDKKRLFDRQWNHLGKAIAADRGGVDSPYLSECLESIRFQEEGCLCLAGT